MLDPEALQEEVDTFMVTYDKKMDEVGLPQGPPSLNEPSVGHGHSTTASGLWKARLEGGRGCVGMSVPSLLSQQHWAEGAAGMCLGGDQTASGCMGRCSWGCEVALGPTHSG